MDELSHRIKDLPISTEMRVLAECYNNEKFIAFDVLTVEHSYTLDEISYMLSFIDNPHPYFVHRMITKCVPQTIYMKPDLHPSLVKELDKNPIYLKVKNPA